MVCFAAVSLVTSVWTAMLCIIAPKEPNISVENEILQFLSVGQVLSPSVEQALSLTLFMIYHITCKQQLQMIMEPTGDQGLPRLLPK